VAGVAGSRDPGAAAWAGTDRAAGKAGSRDLGAAAWAGTDRAAGKAGSRNPGAAAWAGTDRAADKASSRDPGVAAWAGSRDPGGMASRIFLADPNQSVGIATCSSTSFRRRCAAMLSYAPKA
jgi:hypothetical protein